MLGVIAIYLSLLLGSPLLGYQFRNHRLLYRWCIGFVCAILVSGCKEAVVFPALEPLTQVVPFSIKVFFYVTTALWECSNLTLVFGGQQLFHKLGIQGPGQALLVGLVPGQAKFEEAGKVPRWQKCKRAAYGLLLLGLGWVLWAGLRSSPIPLSTLTEDALVETELLALLVTSFVVLLDVPCFVMQAILDCTTRCRPASGEERITVLLPYGFIYTSTSIRMFWRRWSRPAGQLIRYMVFYPLGGYNRAPLSIPAMFLLNGIAHYGVGYALVGATAKIWWNVIFALLGFLATLEVVLDKRLGNEEGNVPSWYKALRLLWTQVALRASLYVFVHRCLGSNLATMLS